MRFSELHGRSGGNVKAELVLYNYATKSDERKTRDVDKSLFAKKVDLVNLKSDIY